MAKNLLANYDGLSCAVSIRSGLTMEITAADLDTRRNMYAHSGEGIYEKGFLKSVTGVWDNVQNLSSNNEG